MIVIESAQSSTSTIRSKSKRRAEADESLSILSINNSERFDERFRAQPGEPFFLQFLRFQLDPFLFDVGAGVGAGVGERFGVAAVFVFDFEDVIIAGELDDMADFARLETKRRFFKWRSQRLALNPAPIAAFLSGAVLGIELRHAFELGAVDEFAENFVGHCFLGGGVAVTGMAWDLD